MPKEGESGFVANVDGRKGTEMTESSLPDRAQPREWTNTEGKTITATLLRVEDDVALLKMANGQVYRYPINKLSDQSKVALNE